jgi:hypothetical protein
MEFTHNQFLVDVLLLLPDDLECLLQAPSLDIPEIEQMFKPSSSQSFPVIIANSEIKVKMILLEKQLNWSMFINRIEIKSEDKLLFEGYDGVEFGVISNSLEIPDWFSSKYIPEYCNISGAW